MYIIYIHILLPFKVIQKRMFFLLFYVFFDVESESCFFLFIERISSLYRGYQGEKLHKLKKKILIMTLSQQVPRRDATRMSPRDFGTIDSFGPKIQFLLLLVTEISRSKRAS